MATGSIILVHLSDIHFHKRHSGGIYDLDADLRNEIERDAEQMYGQLGPVNGLLITGDIAFAGHQEEYAIALQWLQRLCGKLGCPPESIWTTPGNHDVDRSVVDGSYLLSALHQRLRPADPQKVDAELRGVLEDPEAAPLLFRPIKNYLDFAAKFRCDIGPTALYWEHDLILNDGSTLRLRGLNSTLVSGKLDNDAENKLILGTLASTLKREDGVEYLTLCHHPPQWLRDQDVVETNLNARARIQLFGHKHVQKLDQINNTLRLTAGAVHPERAESGWQPRYNYLVVSVHNEGGGRKLDVTIYPRVWNDTFMRFITDYNGAGSDHRLFSLPLEPWAPQVLPVSVPAPHTVQGLPRSEPTTSDDKGTESSGRSTMDPARTLTYRFLTLPYHERLAIAQKLHLLHDEDKSVQDEDAELFKRFFRRAREGNILGQLWDEVESHHHDGRNPQNPFVKH